MKVAVTLLFVTKVSAVNLFLFFCNVMGENGAKQLQEGQMEIQTTQWNKR
jgi:hypothetical protein